MEKETAIHSSILAWEIPRTEEPGGLQSIVSQRVDHDLVTKEKQQIFSFRFVKFDLRVVKEFNTLILCSNIL